MRNFVFAGVIAAALVSAGVAVAHQIDVRSVSPVAATFTATTVSGTSTQSCTNADGKQIDSTNATYAGTATGSPDITGAATLKARSIVNSTDGVGVVSGALKIDASGGAARATFTSVWDHANLSGLAVGRAQGGQLVANLSAAFTPAAGFTNGKLGGGTSGGSAVEIAFAKCRQAPRHERSRATGTVSAVSSTSITVSGLTCTVPANLADRVAALHTGQVVEIRCELTNGVNTLQDVHPRH
jgi:hypothetical protein